jgi:hypothetical protein
MNKILGKISGISFGLGGYQNVMMGLSVSLSGEGSVCSDFKGTWGLGIEVNERTKWTEKDRSKHFDETVRYINKLLIDAKVEKIDQLRGIPVEIIYEGMTLKSWRILTEVI